MDDHEDADLALSRVAGAIAEPARTRMLCALMDGHARTSTELAAIAGVSPSTASAHLARLAEMALVCRYAQGRHRYYALMSQNVAEALEALMVLGQRGAPAFVPTAPHRLRFARTCYDHMAGELAVRLHDACMAAEWLLPLSDGVSDYRLSEAGQRAFGDLGIDLAPLLSQKRRFACPCMDWSMRRPHLAGALGAALLRHCEGRGWVRRDLDGRGLALTAEGQRAFVRHFAVEVAA